MESVEIWKELYEALYVRCYRFYIIEKSENGNELDIFPNLNTCVKHPLATLKQQYFGDISYGKYSGLDVKASPVAPG